MYKSIEEFEKHHSNISMHGFVEFVKTRPADRKINHYGGWVKCAVGDYVARCHRRGRDTNRHRYACDWFANNVLPYVIMLALESPNNVNKHIGTDHTYGELAEWLESKGVLI